MPGVCKRLTPTHPRIKYLEAQFLLFLYTHTHTHTHTRTHTPVPLLLVALAQHGCCIQFCWIAPIYCSSAWPPFQRQLQICMRGYVRMCVFVCTCAFVCVRMFTCVRDSECVCVVYAAMWLPHSLMQRNYTSSISKSTRRLKKRDLWILFRKVQQNLPGSFVLTFFHTGLLGSQPLPDGPLHHARQSP